MAQIEIERKERHSAWPWIIVAIIILLLIWWWASSRRDNGITATRADSTMMTSGGTIATGAAATGAYATGASTSVNGSATAASIPPAVTTFSNWVTTTEPKRDEAGQHTYTAGGLRRLADALAAEGASGSALDSLRKQADALQNSSATSLHHADMTRSAFASAADVIASLATSHAGVAADTARVRGAATAMKPGDNLLDQKDKVQNFFDAARDALLAMGRTS